jgi:hypothetical protein
MPMNCLEFRRLVGAEPAAATPEVTAHAAQCPACARYQREMQQMDQLIHRALAIDVDAPAKPPVERRHPWRWGLAASLFVAVLAGVLWAGYPRETLARDVVDHALHEPDSLQWTSTRLGEQDVAKVLAQSRVRLKWDMGGVSYATNCPFHGHTVPHFVVQMPSGPVTVLLLRDEKPVSTSQSFVEGQFQGVIVPAPQGVLAVIGQNASVDEVAARVLAAVEYE